jgi:hypothetical protein
MNAAKSLGATLMTFKIRTWASRPAAQRPHTVAVVTDKRSATCLTDSRRSETSPPPVFSRFPDTRQTQKLC